MSPDPSVTDRLPPHNRDAERSVLGSMLRDNDDHPRRRQPRHAPSTSTSTRHQKIFQAITTLNDNAGKPVDLVTLAEYLADAEHKQIEDVGGIAYLAELWDAAPTAAHAEHYAEIVREKAIVRNLIHASTEILRDAYDQAQPADELLERAERHILDIAEMGITGHTITLQEAITEAYDRLDTARSAATSEFSGIADRLSSISTRSRPACRTPS